jgi:RNA polymerase sigma factor (sigma-70 family)
MASLYYSLARNLLCVIKANLNSYQLMPIGKLSNLMTPRLQTIDNETEIIAAIIKNDQRVIEGLYYKNQGIVQKTVSAFNNRNLDSDDIYQEGFSITIFNVLEGKFRGESTFSTYLISICRNICLKQLSKQQTVELNESYDSEDEMLEYDLLNSVISFKQQLGDKCREVIDLRFTLGDVVNASSPNKCLSFEDIASILDINPVSARQRFKRCLDKLKEMVNSSTELKHLFS